MNNTAPLPTLEPSQFPVAHSDEIQVITKAVVRACDAWGLTNLEAAQLFDVPIATWNRMKGDAYKGRLDQDKMTRASLIIGMFKGLRLLFNGPLTYGWIKMANHGPSFDGQTPLQFMTSGGIPAMMHVRQHLDALRGGV